MKALLLSLYVSTFWLNFTPEVSYSDVSKFSGIWVNAQPGAFLPEIEVMAENDLLFIQAKANCIGADCIWTKTEALPVSFASEGRTRESLRAVYYGENREVQIEMEPSGETMTVRVREMIVKEDERVSKNYLYTFLKKQNSDSDAGHLGAISGSVFGKAKSTASIFRISLYGPDNGNQYISTHNFSQGQEYRFENLPEGTYIVMVEARGSTEIEANPSFAKVIIKNGETFTHNVELR
ncbi:MAG: hypothetical protein SF052_07915 [Bacteroidia bacterium]|nr:hypothetical protein [Bacteroidia bacterium]